MPHVDGESTAGNDDADPFACIFLRKSGDKVRHTAVERRSKPVIVFMCGGFGGTIPATHLLRGRKFTASAILLSIGVVVVPTMFRMVLETLSMFG